MRFMIVAVAIALAVPAVAQTGDPTATPAPKPKKEKKICRADETRTGSNMVRMACHTQAEWAKIDDSDTGGVSGSASGRSTSDTGTLAGNTR